MNQPTLVAHQDHLWRLMGFFIWLFASPPPQFPSSDSDWTGLEWNLSFSIKKQIKRQITMMAQLDSRNTQYLNVYEKYTFDWLSQYAI